MTVLARSISSFHSFRRPFAGWFAAALTAVSSGAYAAYVNLTPTPIVANGAMVFAGNSIGLNKNGTTNTPGGSGSIGAFMRVNNDCSLNTASVDNTFPAGTTNDWRLGGSCAPVDIPAGAIVRQAVLIWSGSIVSAPENVTANLNDAVTLIRPNGTTVSITPAAGASAQTSGNFYARTADVTSLVTAGGTYGVRGIPATQADGSASGNAGGWTIAVIYELSSLPARAMTIFSGAETGGAAAASVSGFCTPATPTQSGRLMVSAVEGDSGITGDEMRFASTAAILTTPAGLVSGPNNAAANFFSAQINKSDGTLDTRGTFGTSNQTPGTGQIGRQGYDLTNVDVSSKLVASQTSAVAQGTTTGDQYMINALGIQVDVGAPKFPVTTKTVDRVSAQVGDILTYSVVLQNTGTALATNVNFKDLVPPGTSFVPGSLSYQQTAPSAGATVTPAGADPTSAAGVAIPDIAVNDAYTVTFRVRVDSVPASPSSAQYDNSATWTYKYQSCSTSPVIDSTLVTNPATTKVPRLAITKSVSPTGDVSVGDTLTYTIVTTNNGTAPTAGATLADAVPVGSTYVAGSTTLNGGGVADVAGAMPFATAAPVKSAAQANGVIAVGESATVVFKVRVNAGATTVANTATADMDGAGAAPAVSANVSNNVKPPNLTIAKTTVGSFVRGQNGTFNLEVTNAATAGRTDGSVVTVSDSLPVGLELAGPASGAGWSCTGAAGATSFSCTRSDVLNPGATYPIITVTVRVLQSAGASVLNTASVQGGGDTSPSTGDATATITSSADLEVRKLANPANPNVGQNVTFTVLVTNNGPSDATAVTVNDPVPAGMTFVSATPSVGTYTAPTWTIGTLAKGVTAQLTMVATFNGGSATNTATATSATPDPIPGNNTASVSVPSQLADLQLFKSVNNAAPNVGSNVTFTVTVLNNGPDNATNVAIAEALPAGLTLVSATPSVGTYGANSWTIPSLPALASATLTITATVTGSSPITNTAQVTASDQRDPNSKPNNNDPTENDQASVTIVPQSADLQMSKTVNNPNPQIGAPITYTITVVNKGPATAQAVSVNEPQPTGVTFNAASASKGSYTAPTWTIGTVAPNETVTLTINAIYNGPGQVTNTATVTSSTPDPNPSNNTASQAVPAQIADLSLNKTVDNATPDFASEVVFTITVANAGPSNATGVRVADRLPVGLTFISATPSSGTYDSNSGDWNVGSVAAADVATLQIRARVDSPNALTNTAEITKSDQFDPDSVPGNSKVGEDDIASVTITPLSADLSIEKTATPNAANPGDTVTYVVTVKNAGPGAAQGVSVLDALPAGITFVSATPSVGVYSSNSGLWNIGSLAVASTATLTITSIFNPSSAATITNFAQVDSQSADPNPSNNTAKAPVRAKEIDLVLSKVVITPASAQVPVGGQVTFRVSVRNTSAVDDATNVKVNDLLPAGLSFVSSTPSAGSYASGSGVWFIPTIAANATATLDIVATMTATTAQTNRAAITALDQFETNAANNAADATVTPVFVDLVMGKTIDVAAPSIGQTVVFTLSVLNRGPSDATGVTVVDQLPAGFTFASAPAAYASGSGLWTVGTIPSNTTSSINITATFTGPGPALNTARIATVDQPDVNLGNNSASVSVPSQIADLSLTKTANPTNPKPGETVRFTITVMNNGPDAASTVSVNEALPAGLTLVSASASQGTYAAPTWTVGVLANGASANLVIDATMTGTTAVDNTATVSNPAQQDTNAGNNNQTVTITPQRAELSLTKTVDKPTTNVSDTVTFTVTLNNGGPDAATNVVISDALPAGLTYAGATPSVGTYDNATGKWTIASLSANSSATLLINARVDGRGPVTNTAQVTSLDQLDSAAGNSASAQVTGTQADLAITKIATPANPIPGAAVTFTITVTNNGQDAAENVAVADPLPAGFTLNTATPSVGTYSTASGVWTIGSLANGGNATLTLAGIFTGPAAVTNVATVSSSTYDPDTTNNRASATLPRQVSDLAVTKTVDNATPNYGDTVTFTIRVDNAGPDLATNTVLNDTLPAGLTYVSHNAGQGAYLPGSGVWTVGNIANAGSATLTIVARVSSAQPMTNRASVRSDQFDPEPANNAASASVAPVAANLRLAKSVSKPNPANGEIVTYTITVTNDGPSLANPVTVNEALNTALTFVDYVASQGSYAQPTWNVGALALGEQATLTIRARYTATGTAVANTASVSSPLPDPDPSDNSRTVSVPAQTADLSLSKTVDVASPRVGANVTYTITVRNAGPDAATGVVAREQIPAGLTLVSATPSQGTYDSGNGNWQVGNVANGGNATLTIVATVTGTQPIENTAEIIKSDQYDPNSTPNNGVPGENDQQTVTITPQYADLRTSKTVDNPLPTNNEIVEFTIEVMNFANASAGNVVVNDLLPPGLVFVGSTPSQGSYSAVSGVWNVGTLAVNTRATLKVQATYVANGVRVTNTATATSDLPDPVPQDNTASITVPAKIADLSVNKTVAPTRPQVGGTVTYTITVNNAGPDGATNVVLRDQLPAGLQFLNATPSQGNYDHTTGLWSVGAIANAGRATLTITARVTAPTAIVNSAEIIASGQFDPNSVPNNSQGAENDQASAQLLPQVSDLATTKTASVSNPLPNQAFAYTIRVTNNGPDAATNVLVSDALPAGITFTSASATQGTYNATTGVWTVGTLANAAQATLTLNVVYVGPGVVVNTATASSDQFDPNLNNNAGRIAVPSQIADIGVTKTTATATPNNNTDVTFTITATNSGPDAATNVEITDALPAGLTFVSATPSAGAFVSATGKWMIPSLANGANATLTVVARVNSQAAVTNVARVTRVDQFDPVSTNDSAQAQITPQSADLSVTKTVNNTRPAANEVLTFTVRVLNSGPTAAQNVVVTDALPAGLAFVSATATQGAYDAGTGLWTVGTVANAANATLTMQVRYTAPGTVVSNTASVSSSTPDPTPANNSATQNVPTDGPDLTIKKTTRANGNQGESLVFEVLVRNVGGTVSTGEVIVTDTMPAGLTPTLSSLNAPNGWNCAVSAQTITCRRSDALLPSASYPVLVLNAQIADSVPVGPISNTATVSGGGDVISTNNASTTTAQISPAIAKNVPTLSHLALAMLALMMIGVSVRRSRQDANVNR